MPVIRLNGEIEAIFDATIALERLDEILEAQTQGRAGAPAKMSSRTWWKPSNKNVGLKLLTREI